MQSSSTQSNATIKEKFIKLVSYNKEAEVSCTCWETFIVVQNLNWFLYFSTIITKYTRIKYSWDFHRLYATLPTTLNPGPSGKSLPQAGLTCCSSPSDIPSTTSCVETVSKVEDSVVWLCEEWLLGSPLLLDVVGVLILMYILIPVKRFHKLLL